MLFLYGTLSLGISNNSASYPFLCFILFPLFQLSLLCLNPTPVVVCYEVVHFELALKFFYDVVVVDFLLEIEFISVIEQILNNGRLL